VVKLLRTDTTLDLSHKARVVRFAKYRCQSYIYLNEKCARANPFLTTPPLRADSIYVLSPSPTIGAAEHTRIQTCTMQLFVVLVVLAVSVVFNAITE